jgi:uncharacterized oxidoreductase
MKIAGNTILITGGGSGIGRGLAQAFHRGGNQIVIAGRNTKQLDEVASANAGMRWVELDVSDPLSISAGAKKLIGEFPALNVLFNNAGAMIYDDVSGPVDDEALVSLLTTNIMGPVRLTAALIEHLKRQRNPVIVNTSSILGFVPMAPGAIYSITKAAMHSYSLSLRYMLKETPVKVVEMLPPWVRTGLMSKGEEGAAMPLNEFIEEAMGLLATDADEVVVEQAKSFRNNVGPNEWAMVNAYNDSVRAFRAAK